MKFVILYFICGILWGLWEVHYMEHISGQLYTLAKKYGLSDDEYEESRKIIKIISVICMAVTWPLVVIIDVPKVYIFDKIVDKNN